MQQMSTKYLYYWPKTTPITATDEGFPVEDFLLSLCVTASSVVVFLGNISILVVILGSVQFLHGSKRIFSETFYAFLVVIIIMDIMTSFLVLLVFIFYGSPECMTSELMLLMVRLLLPLIMAGDNSRHWTMACLALERLYFFCSPPEATRHKQQSLWNYVPWVFTVGLGMSLISTCLFDAPVFDDHDDGENIFIVD